MNKNIFKQPHQPQEVVLHLNAAMASLVEVALEDVALALSHDHGRDSGGLWRVSLILDGNQREAFAERYANLKRHYDLPEPVIGPLDMRDWVSHVQQHFKPIRAGRFYIYGTHVSDPPPLSSIPILLDAGAAFGTGEHETSKGCLLALDALARQLRPARVLDMGCGSGVLAMAAAKRWRSRVDAVDIDAISVQVARDNVRRNRIDGLVHLQWGNGYNAALVCGTYDLILANILARPLMRMACDLRAHLAPGGVAVLSGLLNRQEQMVLWAHQQVGLYLLERRRIGPWSVLVLQG